MVNILKLSFTIMLDRWNW